MQPARASSNNEDAAHTPTHVLALFNALPGLCVLLQADDPDFTIVAANPAYAAAVLTTPSSLAGRPFFELFPESPHETAAGNLKHSLRRAIAAKASQTVVAQDYAIRPPDTIGLESRRWTAANSPVPGDDGEIRFILHQVEPAPAPKASADADYRFLAESIPQMVWTATADGMLDYVNTQGTAYFGAAQQKLLGAGWLAWVHPEDRERAVKRWQQSLQTGQPYEIEFRLQRSSDTSWRWHLVRALSFANSSGKSSRWFGTCTDINDQKQADANLRHQWHTFDTALSYTLDFAYILDLAGRLVYANRPLLALWRKTLDEACGRNFFELGYPPDLAQRLQLQIQQVIRTKQPVRDQTPFTDADGNTGHYEYILVPVVDSAGVVTAVSGSTRDVTEQNETARRIEEDHRRWRGLLLSAPAAIAVLRGPDHRFEWANPEYSRIIGRPFESFPGRTMIEVVPELKGQAFVSLLDNVFATGEPFLGHEALFRVDRGSGALEDVYVNFVNLATRDAAGAIDGIFIHANDVTDLVVARKRAEGSEQRFRAAIEANRSILWTNNASGQMDGDQPGWSNFTGQTPNEYAGYGWAKAVHPGDAQPTVEAWNRAVEARTMFVFEHRLRRHDGAWRHCSIRAVPLLDRDGSVREWVGVHNDITDERNLLEALRESEARFRQAIDSMPQLVWSTLPDGVPDLYNKQWSEYTGLVSVRQPGEEWDTVHPAEQLTVRERWTHSLQSGDPFEIEFRFRRFNGEYRWFLARATAIRDEDGIVVRWLSTGTDIEDRKKAESAVLTKQKLESLGLLAGGIAHDFNNLLVGMLGGASYAVDSLPAAHPLQPILNGVVTAAERAAHLTRQMLAYAGKGRFFIEPVDIPELARTTCNLIRSSVPSHVQVTLDLPAGLPTVEADSGQIQQIVMNLILNAAESIDESRVGTVAVKASLAQFDSQAVSRLETISGSLVPGSYVVFEVRDNGAGMDAETVTKIFDPFFTTKFLGRGLGLSAVQGILRTHNGALELHSRPGEGSTFRVYLPAAVTREPVVTGYVATG